MTETVYVSTYAGDRNCYHTDTDCHHVTNNLMEKPIAYAEQRDLKECSWCKEKETKGGATGTSLAQKIMQSHNE